MVNRIEDGARYEVFLDKHGKTGYRVWSMEDVLNGRWRMDQVKLKRTRSDEYIWFTASKKVAEEKLNEFVLEMSRN